MKKLIALSIASVFLLTAVVLPVLAKNSNGDENNSSTPKIVKTVDLVCMQNAVEKRDTAITTSFDTYTAKIKTLLGARKDALKTAWTLSDKKTRRAAITKAWKDYRAGVKTARTDWSKAKKAAWKQFYTDRKTCKGTGDDSTTESVDTQI